VASDEAVLRRPGIRLENQANEGHAAMAGQGFAPLTPLLWKGDIAAGRLCVPFPDRISSRGWAYWLIYPRERRMVPKVKRFREWLLDEMRQAVEEIDGGWAAQGRVPELGRQAIA
jgi:LysR family transcriptional regulator, glycine cleavage system transcriptional activator